MDPIAYLPCTHVPQALVDKIGQPGAVYGSKEGKLIGAHWRLNETARAKTEAAFNISFEVCR